MGPPHPGDGAIQEADGAKAAWKHYYTVTQNKIGWSFPSP